jgi:hypothetical protein
MLVLWIILIQSLKTKQKTYYKTYGITNLKKHVDIDHVIIEKTFEEEVNNPIIVFDEKHQSKKMLNVSISIISFFLLLKFLSKNMMCNKVFFCKTIAFWLWKITYICSLLKVFNFTLMFSSWISFQKIII